MFINNLGTFFVIFAGYITLFIILKLLDCIATTDVIERVKIYLRKKLLYNFLIQTLFESCSQIAICCLINFKKMQWNEYGYWIHNLTAICFFMLLIVFPVALILYLSLNMHRLEKPKFESRFGEFYESLNIEKGRIMFLYPLFFVFRRVHLAMTVIYCNKLIEQIFMIVFQIIFSIIFVG